MVWRSNGMIFQMVDVDTHVGSHDEFVFGCGAALGYVVNYVNSLEVIN